MPRINFNLTPPVAYIASVVLDKGLSIITIPLVAAYLTPAHYGRLDVAVSLIEFIGLVMGLGMADTLLRYASVAEDDAKRRRSAAELLTTALLLVAVAVPLLQAAAPWIASALNISVSMEALRWGLLGATLTALVEMPLLWMRMRGRATSFLVFVAARSSMQVALTWAVLAAGYGADGILIANGAAVLVFALILIGWQIAQTGFALSKEPLRRTWRYGLPLVIAALAMFALGSLSRWFMSGRIPDAEIAYFGLAFKLALAAPLLLQPFALWWNPRRIAALGRPGGLDESRWAWSLGYSVLLISALGVTLAGPLFIELVLPSTYATASIYLPFVVLVCFLNELNTLCNTGAYARDNGLSVLGANASGALVAIAGYALFTAPWGIPGIIAAMILGHLTRLVLFLKLGRELAPIRYPVVPAVVVFLLAAVTVGVAPEPSQIVARLAWSAVAGIAVTAALIGSGLLQIPESLLPRSLRKWHVRAS